MAELLGQHRYQLDAKGRIALPGKFRDAFSEGVYLTLGQDGAVYAFPPEEWDRYRQDVPVSAMAPAEDRAFARMVASQADRVKLDGQGRLLIPQSMRERIQLDREAVVLGVFNRLEIWAAPVWDRYEQARVASYMEGTLVPRGAG